MALLVSAGWWVAAVQLTPAADRPYVGGSTNNSELNLIFGYNGFGRLTGNETGSVGGRGAAGSMWGPTGWNRLFLSSMGGQISWLIPGALIGLVAVLWMTRRAPRTDRVRAAFLLFGGWLLLTGAVFSFAHGIIHPYYTVALAPAIGALVGMGASTLWRRRREIFPRLALAAAILATIAWAFVILGWSPTWYPALRWVILVVGVLAAARHRPDAPGPGRAGRGDRRLRHRLDHRRPGRLLVEHGGDPPQWRHPVGRSGHPGEGRRAGFGGLGRGFGGPGRVRRIGQERHHPAQGVHAAQRHQAAQRPHHPAGRVPTRRGPEASVAGRRPVASAARTPTGRPGAFGGFGGGGSEEVPGVGVPAASSTGRPRASS